MLDAAVCGDIFASPTAKQITAGLAAIESEKGFVLPASARKLNANCSFSSTLVIAKNYTGDRLNFALAVERARALGRKIETVVVGDDVAVGRKKGELVGRRGLAGTVLVHKIAGAAAENGYLFFLHDDNPYSNKTDWTSNQLQRLPSTLPTMLPQSASTWDTVRFLGDHQMTKKPFGSMRLISAWGSTTSLATNESHQYPHSRI